jgi:hypothetical protein
LSCNSVDRRGGMPKGEEFVRVPSLCSYGCTWAPNRRDKEYELVAESGDAGILWRQPLRLSSSGVPRSSSSRACSRSSRHFSTSFLRRVYSLRSSVWNLAQRANNASSKASAAFPRRKAASRHVTLAHVARRVFRDRSSGYRQFMSPIRMVAQLFAFRTASPSSSSQDRNGYSKFVIDA